MKTVGAAAMALHRLTKPTIAAVDGVAVASADQLSASLAQREPGESVTISWTDSAGAARSAQVVLVEGPVA